MWNCPQGVYLLSHKTESSQVHRNGTIAFDDLSHGWLNTLDRSHKVHLDLKISRAHLLPRASGHIEIPQAMTTPDCPHLIAAGAGCPPTTADTDRRRHATSANYFWKTFRSKLVRALAAQPLGSRSATSSPHNALSAGQCAAWRAPRRCLTPAQIVQSVPTRYFHRRF